VRVTSADLHIRSDFLIRIEGAMQTINIAEKFSRFSDYWNPRVVGELNDFQIKLVKLRGEFVWHHHKNEDELFLVMQGVLRMKVRTGHKEQEIRVLPGEFLIVPQGVEHLPIADEEVHVMLVEPKTTLNTGNVRNERTRAELERL
jgi:mannose-6-phosphate isomerase-like protein (cupin superfamily)